MSDEYRRNRECLDEFANVVDANNKYRWHDLRKNPSDLPDKTGFYIACVEHPKNHERNTREITLYGITPAGVYLWKKNNRFVQHESVVAWREIEPFESEVSNG